VDRLCHYCYIELPTIADILSIYYENCKKHIDTGIVNIMAESTVTAIVQALRKTLPESLHSSRDEASVGNVQLWRAQGLMIGVLDGEDVGQLKCRK
jgi:hypothetical protein